LLSKAADVLEARAKEFQEALIDEGGAWVGKTMFETGYSVGVYRAAAAAAYQVNGEILPSDHGKMSLVVREPLGVVSVISPWNFPLILSSRGFAVALAVGNAVVLKPSEETPVSGGLLIAEVLEEAGIPKGVFNVVTCSRDNVAAVGDELISNPTVRGISFTGSTAIGSQVAAKAGGLLKKCCVELGGKDALIVLDDADIEHAVNAATFGSFMHQGQICMSVERVIVHKDVANEFIEKFVQNTKKLKVGNPREMANCIGPIINQKQLDKIRDQVEDAVAKRRQGSLRRQAQGFVLRAHRAHEHHARHEGHARGDVRADRTRDHRQQRRRGRRCCERFRVWALGRHHDSQRGTRSRDREAPQHRHGAHQRQLGQRRAARAVRRGSLERSRPPRRARRHRSVHRDALDHARARRPALPAALPHEAGALSSGSSVVFGGP
jgi:hypothetical protein